MVTGSGPGLEVPYAFARRDAIVRLAGAVLAEKDEWIEARRYMSLEILAACRERRKAA